MSYRAVVMKRGKSYGPYLYESYRDANGNVQKRYLGKASSTTNISKKNIYAVFAGILAISLIILLFYTAMSQKQAIMSISRDSTQFLAKFVEQTKDTAGEVVNLVSISAKNTLSYLSAVFSSSTGFATLNINENYASGDFLQGNLELMLKNGELMPSGAKIIVENDENLENTQEFAFSELVSSNNNGKYYIEGKDIDGEGEGYGFLGEKKTYPEIDFTLKIIKEKEISEENKENVEQIPEEEENKEENLENENEISQEEQQVSEIPEEIPQPEQENLESVVQQPEETQEIPQESQENAPQEQEIVENVPEQNEIAEQESIITGEAVNEAGNEEKFIDGKTSFEKSFEYNLDEGENSEIKKNSVLLNGEILPESALNLEKSGSKVTVSTEYTKVDKGFGSSYLTNEENLLEINLENLNIPAKNGEIKIKIVYNEEILAEISKNIMVSEEIIIPEENFSENVTFPEENETLEENLTEQNETIPIINENITLEINETIEINEENLSTKQYKAVINRPVKWIKTWNLTESSTITLPKDAENITIKTGEEVQEALEEVEEYDTIINNTDRNDFLTGKITGQVSLDIKHKEGWVLRAINWLKSLTITGKAIAEEEISDKITETETSKVVDLQDIASEEQVAVEYYTPAPLSREEEFEAGKLVTISASDEYNYTDILAYTELSNSLAIENASSIVVYHYTYQEVAPETEEVVEQPAEIQENLTEIPNETEEILIEEPVLEENETDEIIEENTTEIVNETIETPEEIIEGVVEQPLLTGQVTAEISLEENLTKVIELVEEITEGNLTDNIELVKEEVAFDAYDLDNDGNIDYVEWIVPHLSNQTYEISYSNNTILNEGTFNYTFYNSSGFIQLEHNDSLQELPNSQVDDGYVDMAGNVLLLHLNNDSELGENDTYVNDSSENSNTGDVYGAIVNSTGKMNGAFEFDGVNDYINLTNTSSLNFNGVSLTFSAWIKNNGMGSQHIIRRMGNNPGNAGYIFNLDINNNIQVQLFNGSDSCANNGDIVLNDGQWHFVVGIYNLSDIGLYVDGNLDGGFSSCSSIDSNFLTIDTDAICIGSSSSSGVCDNSEVFNGTLDEVSIWNRSLSDDEILYIYNRQKRNYIGLGEYTSNITELDDNMTLNNFSWQSSGYGELPNEQLDEVNSPVFMNTNINMTGNVLLLHLNNDSSIDENDSLVYDYSGNQNNGTANGSVWTSTGKLNGAFEFFENNSYINCGHDSSLNFSNQEFTVGAWIKRYDSVKTNQIIAISKGHYQTDGWYWWVLGTNPSDPTWDIALERGGASTGNKSGYLVPKDEWHYLVTVIDNANLEIEWYIDGVLFNTTSYDYAFDGNVDRDLCLGNYKCTDLDIDSDYWFNGSIDEVSVWNRSLSADEIADLYRRGSTKLNLTTRSCDDALCDGETFSQVTGTSPFQLNLENNKYFQYSAAFEGADYTAELYNATLMSTTNQSISITGQIENPNPERNQNIFISGHVQVSNGTNLSDNNIFVHLNDSLVTWLDNYMVIPLDNNNPVEVSVTDIDDCVSNASYPNITCIVTSSCTASASTYIFKSLTINSGVVVSVTPDGNCGGTGGNAWYGMSTPGSNVYGGTGGGCLTIYAENLSNSGTINASGNSGGNAPTTIATAGGGAGGGGGGTITLVGKNIISGTITANGGKGGNGWYYGAGGGGAAGGTIRILGDYIYLTGSVTATAGNGGSGADGSENGVNGQGSAGSGGAGGSSLAPAGHCHDFGSGGSNGGGGGGGGRGMSDCGGATSGSPGTGTRYQQFLGIIDNFGGSISTSSSGTSNVYGNQLGVSGGTTTIYYAGMQLLYSNYTPLYSVGVNFTNSTGDNVLSQMTGTDGGFANSSSAFTEDIYNISIDNSESIFIRFYNYDNVGNTSTAVTLNKSEADNLQLARLDIQINDSGGTALSGVQCNITLGNNSACLAFTNSTGGAYCLLPKNNLDYLSALPEPSKYYAYNFSSDVLNINDRLLVVPNTITITGTSYTLANSPIKTDSNGDYNITWTVPDTYGFYDIKLNATSLEGDYGELVLSLQVTDAKGSDINFTEPTPDNATSTTNYSIEINSSINEERSLLGKLLFNWNGTNYTIYNDSLVLMMNFEKVSAIGEDDSTIIDLSNYGNNGTVIFNNGTSGWNESGKYGGGWYFDGDGDYVKVYNNTLIESNSSTIEFWFMPIEDINSSLSLNKGLMSYYYNQTERCALYFQGTGGYPESSTGKLIFLQVDDAFNSTIITDIENWSQNEWHYVVLSLNSNGQNKIYVDAEAQENVSDSFGGLITNEFSALYLGKDQNPNEESFFNGTIDELRIWNVTLGEEEIRQHYYSNLYKYDAINWALYVNQTELSDGDKTYFVSVMDYIGDFQTEANENMTETRTFTFNIIPLIDFSGGIANGTSTSNNSVEINISIDEENLNELVFHLNGTNYTIYNDSLMLMLNFDNLTNISTNYNSGENDTYVIDLSNYGNNGTVYGAIWNSTGKYGGSFEFDGVNDYIGLGTFTPPENITLEAWIRTNNLANGLYYTILGTGDTDSYNSNAVYLYNDVGTITLRYKVNNDASNKREWYTTLPVNEGEWNYIAVTQVTPTGTPMIYLNGVNAMATLDITSGNPVRANAENSIGRCGDEDTNYFNGSIDEVRLWNYSLSEEEIRQHYYSNLYKYDSTNWALYVNQSGLTTGLNNYYAYSRDIYGNENYTEIRVLNITIPEIYGEYQEPDATAVYYFTNVTLYVNITSDIFDEVRLESNFSGTYENYTVEDYTEDGMDRQYYYLIDTGNFTANQNVTWKFYINPNSDLYNSTQEYSFRVLPGFDLNITGVSYPDYIGTNATYFQVEVNNSGPMAVSDANLSCYVNFVEINSTILDLAVGLTYYNCTYEPIYGTNMQFMADIDANDTLTEITEEDNNYTLLFNVNSIYSLDFDKSAEQVNSSEAFQVYGLAKAWNGTDYEYIDGATISLSLNDTIHNSTTTNSTGGYSIYTIIYENITGIFDLIANFTNETFTGNVFVTNTTTIEVFAPTHFNYSFVNDYTGDEGNNTFMIDYLRNDSTEVLSGEINVTIFNDTYSTSLLCYESPCYYSLLSSSEIAGGNYTVYVNATNDTMYYRNNSEETEIYIQSKTTSGTVFSENTTLEDYAYGSDYSYLWNVTLTNLGNAMMSSPYPNYSAAASDFTAENLTSCEDTLYINDLCNMTMNITVSSTTSPGTYQMSWRGYWVDNTGGDGLTDYYIATVVILDHGEMNLTTDLIDATAEHVTTYEDSFGINSTGTTSLVDIDVSVIEDTLPADWITIIPNYTASIGPGSSLMVFFNVTIPEGMAPDTYNSTIQVNTSNLNYTKEIVLNMTVPINGTWYYIPELNESYNVNFSLNTPGYVGNVTINNTGNYPLNLTVDYDDWGDIDYNAFGTALFEEDYLVSGVLTNPTLIYVENQTTFDIPVYQKGRLTPQTNVGIKLNITNSSGTPVENITYLLFTIEQSPPQVLDIEFDYYDNISIYAEYNAPLELKAVVTDDDDVNATIGYFIINWSDGSIILDAENTSEAYWSSGKLRGMNFTANYTPITMGEYNVSFQIWDMVEYENLSIPFNFTSIGNTTVEMWDNATLYTLNSITRETSQEIFYDLEFNNTANVTAYNVTVIQSITQPWTVTPDLITVDGFIFGGDNLTMLTINVTQGTYSGLYYITPQLTWENPDNTTGTATTTISVNITPNYGILKDKESSSMTIEHGTSLSDIIELSNIGNTNITSVIVECITGDVCSEFSISINDRSFELGTGIDRYVNISVAVPDYYAPGVYTGTIDIVGNENQTTLPITITVPTNDSWEVAPTEIVLSKGASSAGEWEGTVNVSNTGNAEVTYNINTSNRNIIGVNESGLVLPANSIGYIKVNYTAPATVETYMVNITISNLSLTTPEINISVNFTVQNFTVQLLGPNITYPNTDMNVSNILEINLTSLLGDTYVTDNLYFDLTLGGTSCDSIDYVYDLTDSLWRVNCTLPTLPDGFYYDMLMTMTYAGGDDNVSYTATETNITHYTDISAPLVESVVKQDAGLNGNVTMEINLSDSTNISSVILQVVYPNDTINNFSLDITHGDLNNASYLVNVTDLMNVGDYGFTYFFDDTLGYSGEYSDTFEVYTERIFQGKVLNRFNNGVYVNFTFLRHNAEDVLGVTESNSSGQYNVTLHNRNYDITMNDAYGNTLFLGNVSMDASPDNSLNISTIEGSEFRDTIVNYEPITGIYYMSQLELNNSDSIKGYSEVNFSGTSYNSKYGLALYECTMYSLEELTCNVSWTAVTDYSIDTLHNNLRGNVSNVSNTAYFVAEDVCGNGACEAVYGETTTTCTDDCKEVVESTTVISGGGGGSISGTQLKKLEDLVKNYLDVGGIRIGTSSIYKELFPGESATVRINLKNVLDYATSISVKSTGDASNFIFFDMSEVTLGKGEDEEFLVRISIPKFQATGTYEGDLIFNSSGKEAKMPVTIKVISPEGKLLDVKIQPLTSSVPPGGTLRIQTDLMNLGKTDKVDVQFDLQLMNINTGEIITRLEEAFAVENRMSVVKELKVPEFTPVGKYMVKGTAYYSNAETENMQATSISYVDVDYPFLQKKLFGISMWIYLTIFLIIFWALAIWMYLKMLERSKKRFGKVKVEFNKLPQPGATSAFLGKIAETEIRAFMDLNKLQMHTLIAGATGGGKTVSAQDLIESVLMHNKSVIVFDPTAQWTGFFRKCEDKGMLNRYHYFDMKPSDVRAFNGSVKTIRDPYEFIELKKYMNRPGEITIFNISKLTPKEIDILVASTIEQVFKSTPEESKELKTLIVYDEVHRLLPKFGGSGQGFLQLERGAREFRKWGIGLVLISQVLSDFVGEIKANIGTEIQLGTRYEGDLERINLKYGEDILKSVVKEPIGTGMLVNADYNSGRPYFVSFRPMLHSTKRLTVVELDKYEKYFDEAEDMEYQIDELKKLSIDTLDLELELKLAKSKIKEGQFQMADMYLESIRPRFEEQWAKLKKKPMHLVRLKIKKELVESGIEKAREERAKYIKKNPQQRLSLAEEIRGIKKKIDEKKTKGKQSPSLELKIVDLENRLKTSGGKVSESDEGEIKKEIQKLKDDIERL